MELKRPFSEQDWQATPIPVREYLVSLENAVIKLADTVSKFEKRIDKLESQLNKNSKNSSKPPSSDPPFKKKPKAQEESPKSNKKKQKKKRKKGGQKGHKGHQQEMLKPTKEVTIEPELCSCGCNDFKKKSLKSFYTHQHIELPKIKMYVLHFTLQQGKCADCGKTVKAKVPKKYQSGYGPRLSACIAELSGSHGASRETVQDFCRSVLDFHISTGAIQNVIDRASAALKPLYDEIGRAARLSPVNYIDETSWFQTAKLQWLWTMTNENIAFFKIHNNRSKEAFEALIEDWKGVLVSDDYGTYKKWEHGHQTCLSHLIRKATGLSESKDESIKCFGRDIKKELQLLTHFAKKPPTSKQWTNFYSRLLLQLMLFENAEDESGTFARSLARHMENLWTFLDRQGVEPTNNRAERALRFGVLWRKRSKGTQSEKGNRWVERMLSFKQTCRIKNIATFPRLVDLINNYFKDQKSDLSWVY